MLLVSAHHQDTFRFAVLGTEVELMKATDTNVVCKKQTFLNMILDGEELRDWN